VRQRGDYVEVVADTVRTYAVEGRV
jgi:hypothetical protein